MKITKRQLRRVIWEAMEQVPRWPESHPAWRDVAFTRDDEIRYILDVADPETVQAAADMGEPFPPGTNVLIIKGATPGSEKVYLHDSELLDLINREGWRIPEPPAGAGPGMWGGHGKWIEDLPEDESSLPPPAMEEPIVEGKKMRITKNQLRRIIRESMAAGPGAVELTDMPDEAAVNAAWPDGVFHNGNKVFDTFYGDNAAAAYDWLENEGYDGQEVYLGYDPQSDNFVMGFDAFEEVNDGMMEGVLILLDPRGRPMETITSVPGGMYPEGRKAAKTAMPAIIDVRLD